MSEGSTFVGRRDEIVELLGYLQRGESVWISGPAGVGKTSLVNHLKNEYFNDSALDLEFCKKQGYDVKRQEWYGVRCYFLQVDLEQGNAKELMATVSKNLESLPGNWQETHVSTTDASVSQQQKVKCGFVNFFSGLAEVFSSNSQYKNRFVFVFDHHEMYPFLTKWFNSEVPDTVLFNTPEVVVLVLSQFSLSQSNQAPRVFQEIPLQPFEYPQSLTGEIWEYVELVIGKQSANPRKHNPEFIYDLSEGLPLLMEAVVGKFKEQLQPRSKRRRGSEESSRQVWEAVKDSLVHDLERRLLRSKEFDAQKELTRLCAVPQVLDVDIFRGIKKFMIEKRGYNKAEIEPLNIEWLDEWPFVERWRYDPLVRNLLLRSLYYRTPETFPEFNQYLYTVLDRRVQLGNLTRRRECKTKSWCWYHMLAARPTRSLTQVLAQFEELISIGRCNSYRYDLVWEMETALDILLKMREEEDVRVVFRLWSFRLRELRENTEDDNFDYRFYEYLIDFQDMLKERGLDYPLFSEEKMIKYLKSLFELFLDSGENAYENAHQLVWRVWEEYAQKENTRVDFVNWLFPLAEEYPEYAEQGLLADRRLKKQMFEMETELPRMLWQRLEGIVKEKRELTNA